MKILLEMRPSLDGFSGIPQETRLTFLALADTPGFEVEGLLQSGNLLLPPGVPVEPKKARELPSDVVLDRLSLVVASLQQHQQGGRFGRLGKLLSYGTAALAWLSAALLSRLVPLSVFVPDQFEDFVWRSFFAKSLRPEDRPKVVRRPHRIVRFPWSLAHWLGVATSRLGHGLYPRLDTRGVDILITETPFPGRVSPGTQLVVRYHDSVPLLLPHTIRNMHHHRAAHLQALRRNLRDGAWFACVSESVRQQLVELLPEASGRSVTIPNAISHHYFEQDTTPARLEEIIWSRRNRSAPAGGGQPWPAAKQSGFVPYLLMVGTLEPRKNHATLLAAWEQLRSSGHGDIQLLIVGSFGWQFEPILEALTPWLERGGVYLLHAVPAEDLRLLYRHALFTVCPSVAEGFDFPGVEAMCCGGAVLASDVAVHRDVFADGASYFDPYSARALADAVVQLRQDAPQRDALRSRALARARAYAFPEIVPRWRSFLSSLAAKGTADGR